MVPGTTRKKPKPRGCPVCRHDLAAQIDDSLRATKVNVAGVGRHYGVPYKQMQRHRDNCLPLRREPETVRLIDAAPAEPVPNTIEAQASALFVRAEKLLTSAELSGKAIDVRGAIREMRSTLELIAKLKGQIDQSASIAIYTAPAWLALQSKIVAALMPYPDARQAVLGALAGYIEHAPT